jgi:hypothetical protein
MSLYISSKMLRLGDLRAGVEAHLYMGQISHGSEDKTMRGDHWNTAGQTELLRPASVHM